MLESVENVECIEFSYTLGGNVNLYNYMENGMEVPQKTKYRTTIWSSNDTVGDISRQKHTSKRYLYPYVHSSTIHDSQDMEAT